MLYILDMDKIVGARGDWVSALRVEDGGDSFEVFAKAIEDPIPVIALSTAPADPLMDAVAIPTYSEWLTLPGREDFEVAGFHDWPAGEIEIRRRAK